VSTIRVRTFNNHRIFVLHRRCYASIMHYQRNQTRNFFAYCWYDCEHYIDQSNDDDECSTCALARRQCNAVRRMPQVKSTTPRQTLLNLHPTSNECVFCQCYAHNTLVLYLSLCVCQNPKRQPNRRQCAIGRRARRRCRRRRRDRRRRSHLLASRLLRFADSTLLLTLGC
jgi:hypothetical protein